MLRALNSLVCLQTQRNIAQRKEKSFPSSFVYLSSFCGAEKRTQKALNSRKTKLKRKFGSFNFRDSRFAICSCKRECKSGKRKSKATPKCYCKTQPRNEEISSETDTDTKLASSAARICMQRQSTVCFVCRTLHLTFALSFVSQRPQLEALLLLLIAEAFAADKARRRSLPEMPYLKSSLGAALICVRLRLANKPQTICSPPAY